MIPSPSKEEVSNKIDGIVVKNLLDCIGRDQLIDIFGLSSTPYLKFFSSCKVGTDEGNTFAILTVPTVVTSEILKQNNTEIQNQLIEVNTTPLYFFEINMHTLLDVQTSSDQFSEEELLNFVFNDNATYRTLSHCVILMEDRTESKMSVRAVMATTIQPGK